MIQLSVVFLALIVPCVLGSCLFSRLLINGKCYYVVKLRLSAYDAEKICSVSNGSLVLIDSQEKQDAMAELLRKEKVSKAWVGGRTMRYKATFAFYGGKPVTYTNWKKEPPNIPKIQRCVYLRASDGYRWVLHQCYKLHKFICETAPYVPRAVGGSPVENTNSTQNP